MATVTTSGPEISLQERERRYRTVRAALREKGVDAALVTGANLFYLSNGLPGERFGILPTNDEPIMVQLQGRFLADISPDVLADAQEWVKDIRASNDAGPLIDRLRELHLENGTIGINHTGGLFGIGHGVYSEIANALPNAKLVDVTDVFANLRTIKSEEEIAMIDRANLLFDLAIERIQQVVRPGMTGAQAVQEGIKAMWEAGGDTESTLGMGFGKVPKQTPIIAHLSMDRVIEPGDIGTLTSHSCYHGYCGHSDQEIVFGAEPTKMHGEMFQAVLHVRDQVLKEIKPGASHADLQAAYEKACAETGFLSSPHSQMHQYGIDVPEFPGPKFLEGRRGRDWPLVPGMIYSISPTLVAHNGEDTLLGGTSLVITETGYRDLGDRKVEMLVAKG